MTPKIAEIPYWPSMRMYATTSLMSWLVSWLPNDGITESGFCWVSLCEIFAAICWSVSPDIALLSVHGIGCRRAFIPIISTP